MLHVQLRETELSVVIVHEVLEVIAQKLTDSELLPPKNFLTSVWFSDCDGLGPTTACFNFSARNLTRNTAFKILHLWSFIFVIIRIPKKSLNVCNNF